LDGIAKKPRNFDRMKNMRAVPILDSPGRTLDSSSKSSTLKTV
jgi:hypothetical protein